MKTGRRGLLGGGIATATAAASVRADTHKSARKKVALIATTIWKYSHGQHFIDRLLEGYGWEGKHHKPPLDLVSVYVDQFPKNDLSRERAQRFGVRIHDSIASALTMGSGKLAVDGVMIIAEHGEYPRNDWGQKLYPRYKFFKEVVKVFEQSGRAVPVFNDKHLSTNFAEAKEMVSDAHRLKFPFMAGSSLPVTWRLPALELPLGTPLRESVIIAYGGVDSYDIHALEAAQSLSERRAGGETGVRSVQAVRGAKVWQMLKERPDTTRLATLALSRSHTLKLPAGYSVVQPTIAWAQEATHDAIAYFIEHNDGFRTTLLLLEGLVSDFNYAGRAADGQVYSCQMYLPMPPRHTTLADFFNPLFHHAETMIQTGRAPFAIERTLLTTGMVVRGIESLNRQGESLDTPELAIRYAASADSTFWRS